jgi:hypothetical protein
MTLHSWATPKLSSVSEAPFMVSQSEALPMTTATRGFLEDCLSAMTVDIFLIQPLESAATLPRV